jgi:hypothetical protein
MINALVRQVLEAVDRNASRRYYLGPSKNNIIKFMEVNNDHLSLQKRHE